MCIEYEEPFLASLECAGSRSQLQPLHPLTPAMGNVVDYEVFGTLSIGVQISSSLREDQVLQRPHDCPMDGGL